MDSCAWGIALFGDVVASRRDAVASSAWLRQLSAELDAAFGDERVASFGFTQGDELQGLLTAEADPLRAVLIATLHEAARPMRWAIAAGPVEQGSGPATQRTGDAFLRARAAITRARERRDGLVVVSGDTDADGLLDDLAPVLSEMLAGLTERQRTVGRLMLVSSLRQAEVAERLGISRASVSVTAARARVRSIGRLADAVRTILGRGIASERAMSRGGADHS